MLIPNGLTLPQRAGDRAAARRRLGIGPDQFAIMTVGRMEYQKNHVLALRAFAVLPESVRKRSVLFFAGSGEEEDVLRGLALALHIGEQVRFLGYRNDVPELLAGVDLVLMTSWFEGMPLTLLEAMLAGVPIVSTPWLGARNMLADGRYGFLTPSFEPAHVAAQIERTLAHPRCVAEIAERAQRHVCQLRYPANGRRASSTCISTCAEWRHDAPRRGWSSSPRDIRSAAKRRI